MRNVVTSWHFVAAALLLGRLGGGTARRLWVRRLGRQCQPPPALMPCLLGAGVHVSIRLPLPNRYWLPEPWPCPGTFHCL